MANEQARRKHTRYQQDFHRVPTAPPLADCKSVITMCIREVHLCIS
jgi:hypothetical protein